MGTSVVVEAADFVQSGTVLSITVSHRIAMIPTVRRIDISRNTRTWLPIGGGSASSFAMPHQALR